MDQAKRSRQISSYCMSESSSKFHIENDHSFPISSFAELAKINITSEDLYLRSIPIDTVEQYQVYLETDDFSLANQTVYYCTLPRFGALCQYELYYYHENYSSLHEIIHDYYKTYFNILTNMTCYKHLTCRRGHPPACLDWTEICNGKVDCLDGDYDEEHCWQLELNKCNGNEYQCKNGLCIPYEFVRDDQDTFDCIDRSDELVEKSIQSGVGEAIEPAFGYEDVMCQRTFVTSSCIHDRDTILLESMFSVKDNNVSNECWSAVKCYLAMSTSEYPIVSYYIIENECIPTITKECPDMLPIPNIPLFFGHVYTIYNRSELISPHRAVIPYLCSNKSLHDDSLTSVFNTPVNNTTCYKISELTLASSGSPSFTYRFHRPMDNVFQQIKQYYPIVNFPQYRCNESNLYQCFNSTKCISFTRLIDDIHDCPYSDDENIHEDTNPQLFAQFKHKFYKCYVTNIYIPLSAVFNWQCDCGYDEYNFCEDEYQVEYTNHTRRIISFQTMCDGFQELYPIAIDGTNYTDETECEQWECDNIYTRCDKVRNCFDGKDEVHCNPVISSLLNCSSDSRMCVTLDTYQLTCLPINQFNDGHVDCLGGTDELTLCRYPYLHVDQGFYCVSDTGSFCLQDHALCSNSSLCLYDDDDLFCEKNRSFAVNFGICVYNYIFLGSDVEKFLCDSTQPKPKARAKYFRINGFNESYAIEVDENELTNVVAVGNDLLPISLIDNPRCNRGLDVRVWLNKSFNLYTSTCLCPPSYYGNQCQYQNQRVSLAIRFHTSVQSRHILYAILVLLIDDTNQRIIHSFEQFTYLSIRDCKIKFNLYLLYSTRPKHPNRTYSIHVDIYDKHSLTYRSSFVYPVKFSFLPVHRLAFIVNIPSEDSPDETCSSYRKCIHGRCINYFNTKQTFCQCKEGWSGEYCDIPYNHNCSSNSLSIGLLSNNRSICVCKVDYFGLGCYIRNRICDRFPCQNNGSCIPHDDFMSSSMNRKYFCICPKGFSGEQCQVIDTQINLVFNKDIHLSHSAFIHFIQIIPFNEFEYNTPITSPQRSTTLQTVLQATNSLRIYWSQPFHLIFIETTNSTYYLSVIQSIYNRSTTITQRIHSSHRCPSINELTNSTFAELHAVRRMKSYHSICQRNSPDLQCFHDDAHLCLCYDHHKKRLANCFDFDHQMKFDCFGQNHCKNNGQCFQDSLDCPKRSICVCRSCHYGSQCQFTTSEFGLSLDAILAYHIIPDVNIFHQSSIVQFSFSLTILFVIVGLINGILSLITFKSKTILEVGCGIYLLGSSITTILTMILFGLKYFIYLSTQISTPTNETFLKIECHSLDFLLRICLNMDQWLNACVAMERVVTVMQGTRFLKNKSKQLAKKVLICLLLLTILTSIHDPIHRHVSKEEDNDDETKKRIWCIVHYSSSLQVYNRIMNTFHFFLPFLINFISSILLITTKSEQKLYLQKNKPYLDMLREQFREHQQLLTAPVILFLLALPRLTLSYLTKCMNSTQDSWIFLNGYFISFIPPMTTFLIFVMPSKFYKNEYRKMIIHHKNQIQQYFS